LGGKIFLGYTQLSEVEATSRSSTNGATTLGILKLFNKKGDLM
jgi:hypothetical protein